MPQARTRMGPGAGNRPRFLPKAKPWTTRKPEQCLQAAREVRLLILDRLSKAPCTMLDLRTALPDSIAAGLVNVMEALVLSGTVAAIGPGLYAMVAEPDGRPVRAYPAHDLAVACLAVATTQGEIAYYTGQPKARISAGLKKAVMHGSAQSPGRGLYYAAGKPGR